MKKEENKWIKIEKNILRLSFKVYIKNVIISQVSK